jgi:hypothetical protein
MQKPYFVFLRTDEGGLVPKGANIIRTPEDYQRNVAAHTMRYVSTVCKRVGSDKSQQGRLHHTPFSRTLNTLNSLGLTSRLIGRMW